MKKVLSLLLAVVFVFTLVISVHATNGNASSEMNIDSVITADVVNILQEMLGQIRTDSEGFGFNDVDFSELSLGSEIEAYRTGYQQITDIKYYPIFEDGRIIAIATIYVDPKGNPHITIGADFASELQKYTEKHNTYALLFEGDNLYAISQNGKGHLRSFPNLSHKTVKTELHDKSTINYGTSIPLFSLSVDEVSILNTNWRFLSIPIKLQYNDGNCWAACVASIGEYKSSRSYTAREICDIAEIGYDEGAFPWEAQEVMFDVFGWWGLSTLYWHPPSVQKITSDIQNWKPIYAHFQGQTNAHAVVFRGYSSNMSSFTISYMDPNFDTFRAMSVSQDGQYYITGYGEVMECLVFLGLTY